MNGNTSPGIDANSPSPIRNAATALLISVPVVEPFGAGPTAPGELRLWTLGGALVSVQALFFQPEGGPAAPRVDTVYLSWGDRKGGAASRAAALRSLLASVPGAAGDTSLGARWITARRLAEQADSALAAGDLIGFGQLFARLTRFLGVKRHQLAPPTSRR